MHISKLLYGLLFVSWSLGAVAPDALMRLNEGRIATKQEEVHVRVARNYWEKLVFYAVVGSAVGGAVYHMWPNSNQSDQLIVDKKVFNQLVEYGKQGVEASENVAEVVEKIEPVSSEQTTEAQVNMFVSLYNSGKRTVSGVWGASKEFVMWSAKTGWQGAVSSFIFHHMMALSRFPDRYLDPLKGVGSCIENGITSAYGRLFFKPTLQWYVKTQTHLKDLFFDLYTRAYVLEHHQLSRIITESDSNFVPDETLLDVEKIEAEAVSAEDVALYYERFSASWDACIQDIEGLIGFLRFKQSHYPEYADAYKKTCDAVCDIVNRCTDEIEREYVVHKHRGNKVETFTQKVKNFTRLLQAECDSCIIFEQAYA